MKWFVIGTTAIVILLLIRLGSGSTDMTPRGEQARLSIVSSVARPLTIPPITGRSGLVPAPPTPVPPLPEVTTVARTDTQALADLFDAQVRDPAWAPGAEANIRSHLSANAEARCAEFMCKITMPLPDRSMTQSADQQADAASRYWPTNLSYNHLTATIADDHITPTLTFYVTRSASEDRNMS